MKKTKKVPTLRFPGFSGEWKSYRLIDVSEKIQDGTHFSPQIQESGTYKYITSRNIRNGYMDISDVYYINEKDHEEIYKRCDVLYNDVLITKDGAGTGNVCLNEFKENISLLSSVAFIRANKNKTLNEYIYQYICCPIGKNEIESLIAGQAITRITLSKLKNFSFKFPPLPEQQKIASFLTSVDERIRRLARKKELLERYKKGVMQKIFSRKIRFKDDNGKEFPKWKDRKLNEVLFEHNSTSTGKEEVHSVSVHKGVINQIEHLGRSFSAANTDHYNLVKPHDIIYTKSPTGDFPFGIIKQSKLAKNVIVSPLYGVFTPETSHLGYMLDVYFESKLNVLNYLSSIVQKGAKNTINITNNTFLSKSLCLPVSQLEQKKIASLFMVIDKKIDLVTTQLEKTKTWKKGLLQKMFI